MSKRSYFQSSPSGSSGVSTNSKHVGRDSGNKSFLDGDRGPRGKFKTNYQNHKTSQPYQQKQPMLSTLDQFYAKDLSEEIDFKKEVNIITKNLKINMNSFSVGCVSKGLQN